MNFLGFNDKSDSVCIFLNSMSVRYVYWDTLTILVLPFKLPFIFEDMWFYWNDYPFELFNCESKWLRSQNGLGNGESPVSLYFVFMYMHILLINCSTSKQRRNQTPTKVVSAWFVSLRSNYLELFLVLKTIFLNFCKISSKLSTTESDNSNVSDAAPLKSLSELDILLPILQKFRNFFLKKHLRKTAEATCTCFNVMALHSSNHQRYSVNI